MPKQSELLKGLLAKPAAKQPVIDVITRQLMTMQHEVFKGTVNLWDQRAEDLKLIIAECEADLKLFAERKERSKKWEDKGEVKSPRFPPSGAGDCVRKLWFRHFDAPTDPVPLSDTLSGHFIREVGTQMHLLVQLLLAKAGVIVEREARIKTKPPLPTISGFCDGLLDIDGPLGFELKTISDDRLRQAGGKPLGHHLQQVRLYQAVHKMPFSLLYLTRNTCRLEEHIIPYDGRATALELIKPRRFQRCVERKLLPKREGDNLAKAPCRWCSFTAICNGGMKLKEFVDGLK